MTARNRIAVIVPPGGDPAHERDLLLKLATMQTRPVVRVFKDLYADVDAVRHYAPQVLLLAQEQTPPPDLGALRLIATMVPGMAVLLLCSRGAEVALGPAAQEHGFGILAWPATQVQLATAIAECLESPHRRRGVSYLDFARGICDEINNPLLLAAGHLQLLQTLTGEELQPQVDAVRAGLARIETTMAKVRTLSRAAERDRRDQVVLVRDLAAAVQAAYEAAGTRVRIDTAAALAGQRILGDHDLLTAALSCLGSVAQALSSGADLTLELRPADENSHLQARLWVAPVTAPDWQLPRAFDPYHVNRVLQGSPHGLDLFLVQTVARSHGGEAVVRRAHGDGLEFLVGLGPLLS
ncbi:MAG: sensor histidine kinase [Planctomycetota bacterium]|jgi:signal transduction histidine kinase